MTSRESQEPALAFLAHSQVHRGEPVKRIDTHAAVIFLAGARALKVKRAVTFPFLDYSTLDKRREACESELRINRPFAPEIYERVVPITRSSAGGLELGGDGPPVEWAVAMHRFDENATLDHLAQAGRIDAGLADALGRAVAQAHAKTVAAEPNHWIDALAGYIEEHVEAFGHRPDLFPAHAVETLAGASRVEYARIHPLLVERGRRGLIRRIHGDLPLGNIVLLDGRPVLFDAVEFSDLIASGDLLYDLAFLLMDLTERSLRPAANIVLNRYLVETGRAEDLDTLAALPLFLSLRAAIRAKVSAARLTYVGPQEIRGVETSARRYFDYACGFVVPARPALVAIGGLSGTGKSVLARALAPELDPAPGAVVLRSDIERKALFGKGEEENLGADAYAPPVTVRVFATLADKARRVLAAGHSAIVDAVFSKPEERLLIEQSASVLGIPFRPLFLEADLPTRVARVGARELDASDADAAVAGRQESYDLGPLTWPRIDACGTPEETAAHARALLRGD